MCVFDICTMKFTQNFMVQGTNAVEVWEQGQVVQKDAKKEKQLGYEASGFHVGVALVVQLWNGLYGIDAIPCL